MAGSWRQKRKKKKKKQIAGARARARSVGGPPSRTGSASGGTSSGSPGRASARGGGDGDSGGSGRARSSSAPGRGEEAGGGSSGSDRSKGQDRRALPPQKRTAARVLGDIAKLQSAIKRAGAVPDRLRSDAQRQTMQDGDLKMAGLRRELGKLNKDAADDDPAARFMAAIGGSKKGSPERAELKQQLGGLNQKLAQQRQQRRQESAARMAPFREVGRLQASLLAARARSPGKRTAEQRRLLREGPEELKELKRQLGEAETVARNEHESDLATVRERLDAVDALDKLEAAVAAAEALPISERSADQHRLLIEAPSKQRALEDQLGELDKRLDDASPSGSELEEARARTLGEIGRLAVSLKVATSLPAALRSAKQKRLLEAGPGRFEALRYQLGRLNGARPGDEDSDGAEVPVGMQVFAEIGRLAARMTLARAVSEAKRTPAQKRLLEEGVQRMRDLRVELDRAEGRLEPEEARAGGAGADPDSSASDSPEDAAGPATRDSLGPDLAELVAEAVGASA